MLEAGTVRVNPGIGRVSISRRRSFSVMDFNMRGYGAVRVLLTHSQFGHLVRSGGPSQLHGLHFTHLAYMYPQNI